MIDDLIPVSWHTFSLLRTYTDDAASPSTIITAKWGSPFRLSTSAFTSDLIFSAMDTQSMILPIISPPLLPSGVV